MMQYIFNTFAFILLVNSGFSQTLYHREIFWNTKCSGNQSYEQKYMWFDNAIYPHPKTMIPVYFELIDIDNLNIQPSGINIQLANEQWELLGEPEKVLIQEPEKFLNENFNFIVSKAAGKNVVQLTVPAIRKVGSNSFEKLISFSIAVSTTGKYVLNSQISKANTTKTASVLSSGTWVKFSVEGSGIYKITYSELQANGLSNPSNISVWGNGGKQLPYLNSESSPDDLNPIPIYIDKGTDNVFNKGDYILFYAEGPEILTYDSSVDMLTVTQHPYTKQIHYFLTTDQPQTLLTTDNVPSAPITSTTSTYDAVATFEENDTNLVKSGREWFGETFDLTTTRSYNTRLSNPETGSTLKVWLRAAARSSATSSYLLKANSTTMGSLYLNAVSIGDELADVVSVKSQVYSATIPTGDLILELTYSKSNSTSVGWLDFITVNARQNLTYSGSQLMFRDLQSVGTNNVTQFNLQSSYPDVQVWDITNINQAKKISAQTNGSLITLKVAADTLRNFIAFEPSNAKTVSFEGTVTNQNLHGLNQPDMVIVTNSRFIAQAEEIAAIHQQNDNLSVNVATNEQVYNEFSSGNPDVSAIRNLMRMLYQRATSEDEYPKYLLLLGDGSYDNLSTKNGNTNYVLTYQSERSINKVESFVTDDYFGLLDESEGEANGLLDIGIGRIPAKTTDEADLVVDKIKQYISTDNTGNWQNRLCFIGDDEDGNIHMEDANTLADYIADNHAEYNVQKIFFDAYTQESSSAGNSYPDVTGAINTTVNNGTLLVNYTGHGNERWLAHEKVVMLNDVLSWKNYKALSLFVTATCEFSRFDDYNLTSTGEWILLSPKGGGIALLSTTRLVYSNPNFVLNYNFIKNLFVKDGTSYSYSTLGDLVKITKNLSGSGYNKRNFTLLGDPALKLRYPNYEMELSTVNGAPVEEPVDTLKALSEVILEGKIVSYSGSIADNFNGTATVTIFDKEKDITTLANDGGSTMTFSTRDNIIYKGEATVKNGLFTISLMVPKDINYQYGTGKISLFATNNAETAMGSNESVIVGGFSENSTTDDSGPEISIFLNDENFTNGGICDPNPKLLIRLYDESGINTTGIGIGHDITATLSSASDDGQNFNLNSYYQSDLDSYQHGSIEYQLANLTPGVKTIKVKAWDNYNNSSESEITFRVTPDSRLIIKNFYGYPNPFSDETSMYFEHNQPDADFDIDIQIFNLAGMMVRRMSYSQPASGNYRIGPIQWNGQSSTGSRLGRGMYICKLAVRSSNGDRAQLQQKLIILR